MSAKSKEPPEILIGMKPWWDGRRSAGPHYRSEAQKNWDSAIMAAAEYIRRRTKNEGLSYEVHSLISSKLPKV